MLKQIKVGICHVIYKISKVLTIRFYDYDVSPLPILLEFPIFTTMILILFDFLAIHAI